jgi:hypothetical protein
VAVTAAINASRSFVPSSSGIKTLSYHVEIDALVAQIGGAENVCRDVASQ